MLEPEPDRVLPPSLPWPTRPARSGFALKLAEAPPELGACLGPTQWPVDVSNAGSPGEDTCCRLGTWGWLHMAGNPRWRNRPFSTHFSCPPCFKGKVSVWCESVLPAVCLPANSGTQAQSLQVEICSQRGITVTEIQYIYVYRQFLFVQSDAYISFKIVI